MHLVAPCEALWTSSGEGESPQARLAVAFYSKAVAQHLTRVTAWLHLGLELLPLAFVALFSSFLTFSTLEKFRRH